MLNAKQQPLTHSSDTERLNNNHPLTHLILNAKQQPLTHSSDTER